MSERDRRDIGSDIVLGASLAIVAAIILLFVAGISAQNAYRVAAGEKRAAQHERDRQSLECSPIPFLLDPCSPVEPDTNGDAETAEYDLAAQNRMADWAAIMVFISGLGVVVTGIGVAYVALTLDEARKTTAAAIQGANAAADANVATLRATDAAIKANEIARDSAERQLRAYLSSPEITVRDLQPGLRPTVELKIKNTGQTPANILKCAMSVKTTTGSAEAFPIIGLKPQSRGIVGAGANLNQRIVNDREYTADWSAYLTSGREKVVIAGVVIYEDVFGRTRRTTYRTYIDPKSIRDGSASVTVCRRNNKAS